MLPQRATQRRWIRRSDKTAENRWDNYHQRSQPSVTIVITPFYRHYLCVLVAQGNETCCCWFSFSENSISGWKNNKCVKNILDIWQKENDCPFTTHQFSSNVFVINSYNYYLETLYRNHHRCLTMILRTQHQDQVCVSLSGSRGQLKGRTFPAAEWIAFLAAGIEWHSAEVDPHLLHLQRPYDLQEHRKKWRNNMAFSLFKSII